MLDGMCGRFTLRAKPDTLAELFLLAEPPDWSPRYNIAPTQPVPVVRHKGDGGREFVRLRWGLVPSWAKEVGGPPLINARAETVATKPAFRSALKQRRCLIPADGFYEWLKAGKKKQPFSFRLWDDKPFAFAGLWERWTGGEQPLESCTIITTDSNELVRPTHDRMPVILPVRYHAEWLDPDVRDPDRLVTMLRPYPAEEMVATPLSDWVNSPRHDDPRCLEASDTSTGESSCDEPPGSSRRPAPPG
jgi:putative SOS response-associated peptidase YedK